MLCREIDSYKLIVNGDMVIGNYWPMRMLFVIINKKIAGSEIMVLFSKQFDDTEVARINRKMNTSFQNKVFIL